ncbi:MAG TPA: dihydrofolate reductase [Crocinitomicaceae bacterium]|nr:dihydrofolate reductase [Crocinitomicaceae bacterium]
MKTTLIVAMDKARGIGKNNDLMWHLPADMKFFKETTTGHIVLMGRKNFESIPEKYRPLVNRDNIILTRNTSYSAEGCTIIHDMKEVVDLFSAFDERTLFIIGGGEIYRLAMEADMIDEMIITHVNENYDADTFFPPFELCDWKVETVLTQEKNERHKASFTVVKYTKLSRSREA